MRAMSDGWRLSEFPGAVLLYDGNGDVIEANDAAGRLLGVSPEDLIGSSADDAGWLVVDSVDGPITVHPVTAVLRTGQAARGVLARFRRPDGTDAWVQADATPQDSHILLNLTDVTYLIAHSRISSRSSGDHIVDEVTDSISQARMEPRAILSAVTRALARLRPGIWVASLMGKDPSDMHIVATSHDDFGDFAGQYVDAMQDSGSMSSTPISSRVIESGQPLLIPSISVEGLMDYLDEGIRGYLGLHPWAPGVAPTLGIVVVPMRARGATIGTLGLFERRGSNPLTEKDTVWVQAIADRTALAVENAQAYEDAVKRLDRLAALQSVSLAVSASPDLRLTFKVILDHVTAQLKVDAADILLLDESDNSLTLAASTGFLATAVHEYRLPADEGIPGQAIHSRRIETVTGLSAFSQFRRRSVFAREGFKAYGAVPLSSRGRLLGALEVFQRSTLTPDEEWLAFLDALGSVAAVAIDSATMQERLRHVRAGAAPRTARVPPDMSRLEREIMRLVVEGKTNREIAGQVHLSQNTIKFHMRQILQKTGASNRTELAHQAAKEGWI
jgi:DNA-binding CsgD family transcriptional regulator